MLITRQSTTTPLSQRWCGQEQPHPPHTWVTEHFTYASCSGHA